MATKQYTLFLYLVFFHLDISEAISRQSDINFENNGYSDILIAFDSTIPYSPSFLSKTKEYFTQASKFLYNATRHRAFFKDIKILVPDTWPDDPSYQSARVDQTEYKSDIIITSTRRYKRNIPETRTYGGCGSQGIHIMMNTDFLFRSRYPPYYGRSDKFIVHSWATFRWGVFQEYPSAGENPFYFSTAWGKVDGVKCSNLLKGRSYVRFKNGSIGGCQVDLNTGLYADGCIYYAYPRYPAGVQTSVSLMDHQYIQEVTGFCDDSTDYQTKHNAEPLNRQNRLCSHRSTWDVITNTPDFVGGKNSPTSISNLELVPRYTIIKAARHRRSAILLDTSNTENSNSLLKMYQSAVHFIDATADAKNHVISVPENLRKYLRANRGTRSILGLKDVSNMEIDFQNIRSENNLFPEESKQSQKQILVLSNNHTNMANMNSSLSETAVHWVSFNQHPGTKEKKTTTDYYQHPHTESSSHLDAVYDIIEKTEMTGSYVIKIYSLTKNLHPGQEYNDTFSIDKSINGDMLFTLTYFGDPPLLQVTSPTGKLYNESSDELEVIQELKLIRLRLSNSNMQKGRWRFRIKQRHNSSCVSLVVTAKSELKDRTLPIRLKARLVLQNNTVPPKMGVYADVTQGLNPVTGLEVFATVFTPGGIHGNLPETYKMHLFDRGTGADIIKDDGIYSRYFPHLTGFGHYKLAVDIFDSRGYVIIKADTGDTSESVDGVSRSAYGGSLYLHPSKIRNGSWISHAAPGSNDTYPPSRIIDLEVLRKLDHILTVTLSWTAPGGDLDHGKADRYELKYGHNGSELLQLKTEAPDIPETAVVSGSLNKPLPVGSTEYLTLNVSKLFSKKRKGFAFILRAADEAGNFGEFSNMVTVGFDKIPDYLETQETGNDEELDKMMIEAPGKKTPEHKSLPVPWPLIFLNVVLLVCFSLIGMVVLLVLRRNVEPTYTLLKP